MSGFSSAKIGSAAALVMACTLSQAAMLHYQAFLDGPSESPPNASPGTGLATVDFDTVLHTMKIHIEFSGLVGTTTACHIHAPTAVAGSGTAGVATTTPSFSGFPAGVTSGTYDNILDLSLASSWNPSYITANGGTPATAEAAFLAAIAAGKGYVNVHTNVFGGGEIRGFLQEVPSPGALGLAGIGGLVIANRRRR